MPTMPTMTTGGSKTRSVKLSKAAHESLKLLAAMTGKTMSEVVLELVEPKLQEELQRVAPAKVTSKSK